MQLSNSHNDMKKIILGALAFAGVLAGPALSYAQMYAYVDQAGDVRTVDAASANAALMTAPSIDEHSGVMIIDSSDDSDVVGDDVPGV